MLGHRLGSLLLGVALIFIAQPMGAQLPPWTLRELALAMDGETPPNFYTGTAAGLFRSTDEAVTWRPLYITPAGRVQPIVRQILINPSQPNRIYLRTDRTLNVDTSIYRSEDRGATWTPVRSGIPQNAVILRLFPDLNSSSRVYAHVEDGGVLAVYRTTNRGDTWSLQATLPADAINFDIHLAQPTLWYYTTRGSVYRSTNEGQSWEARTSPPITSSMLNGIYYVRSDPQDTNVVFAGGNGNLLGNATYRSVNQGSSWVNELEGNHGDLIADDYSSLMFIRNASAGGVTLSRNRGLTWEAPARVDDDGTAGSIPSLPLVDRRDSDVVYTAPVKSGLYISTDGARSWEKIEALLQPTIAVAALPAIFAFPASDLSPLTRRVEVVVVEDSALPIDATVTTSGESFLSVSTGIGTTPFSLDITVDPGTLPLGEYHATVTIASDLSANGTFEVPITVTVDEALPPGTVPTILSVVGGALPGTRGENVPALEIALPSPQGVAAGPDGALFVSDRFDHRMFHVSPNPLVSTLAGTGAFGFGGDGGPATAALLNFPADLAIGPDGSVYIADTSNRRIRRVAPNGTITTVAGNGESGAPPAAGTATNVPISASGVVVDSSGVLYVASTTRLLRIVQNGAYTTRATTIDSIDGLALDAAGNLYIAQPSANRVRRVLPDGTIEEFAGAGLAGFGGDGGPASAALLNRPAAVAVDAEGNVYIADTENHSIRRVDTEGIISTYVGNGVAGFRGDGGPASQAQLDEPTSVAAGADGVLYIADRGNDRVRAVFPTGVLYGQISSAGIVNAASFLGGAISPGSIITLFGISLADQDAAAGAELPFELGGTTVEIVDSTGTARPAGIFGIFRGQAQMNLYVDPETALGPALMRLTKQNGQVTVASIDVNAVAPGIFFVQNGAGQNVALAQYLRVSGGQVGPLTLTFSAADFSLTPIDLGPEGDLVFVALFGTGIRGAGVVTATVDGEDVPVSGFAPAAGFFGLDQANIGPIPRSFIGAGPVEIRLSVDGVFTNVVMASFQ